MKTVTRTTPSMMTNHPSLEIGSQLGEERGADLEDHEREPDRDREREEERPAPDLRRLLVPLRLLLRRVVRGDAERAETDRERLPERDTPRTTGSRRTRWRAISGSIDFVTCAISPSGLRTATAQLRGPRIITPSRTAWPPMAWLIWSGARRARRAPAFSSRRWKRSTRPPVSTASASPCRTGGTRRTPRRGAPTCVERVWNVFPHEQCTVERTYSGWMSAFMAGQDSRGRLAGDVAARDDNDGRARADLAGEPAPRRRPRRQARTRASPARRGTGTPPRSPPRSPVTSSMSRQISSGMLARERRVQAVGDRARLDRNRTPVPRLPRGAPATSRARRRRCAPGRRAAAVMPGDQPAPSDRDDDGVGVGRVLLDLEPDRPRAGDHERVVERVDERPSRLCRRTASRSKASAGARRLQIDVRAVAARRVRASAPTRPSTSRRARPPPPRRPRTPRPGRGCRRRSRSRRGGAPRRSAARSGSARRGP